MTICVPTLSLPFQAFRSHPFGRPEISTFTRSTSGYAYSASPRGGLVGSASNVLRHDFDQDTAAYNGMLVEESRTNVCTYSDQISHANWTKSASSVTANVSDKLAPDLTATADKLVEDNTSANHYTTSSTFVTTSGSWTASGYARAGERATIFPRLYDGSTEAGAKFNLSSGAVVSADSGVTASISSCGNGWYRWIITRTVASSSSSTLKVYLCDSGNATSYAGDGASGVYLWGMQAEAGAFATSYIPTSSASVTRPADLCTIPTSSFDFNSTEGTILVTAKSFGTNSESNIVHFEFDANNWLRIGFKPGAVVRCQVLLAGAAAQIDLSGSTIATNQRIAFAYRGGDFAACRNGGAVSTISSPATVPSLTTLYLGSGISAFLNGTLLAATYFPRRMTNADLQLLTG